jgi:hypothetical protein
MVRRLLKAGRAGAVLHRRGRDSEASETPAVIRQQWAKPAMELAVALEGLSPARGSVGWTQQAASLRAIQRSKIGILLAARAWPAGLPPLLTAAQASFPLDGQLFKEQSRIEQRESFWGM